MKIIFKAVFYYIFCFLLFGEAKLVEAKDFQVEVIDRKIYQRILKDINLTEKEFNAYKKTFDAIEKENIKEQNAQIKQIHNDIFMGHIQAERYLSQSYRSTFTELNDWLKKYNKYPQRHKIYKLAKRKAGKKEVPTVPAKAVIKHVPSGYSWYIDSYSNLNSIDRKYVKNNVRNYLRFINTGKTKLARGILEDKRFISLMPKANYAAMCGTIATVYFIDNHDILALKWAERGIDRHDDATAYWFGGLAAWRLNDYEKAAEMFDALSKMDIDDEWLLSAGGYWAFRAYSKMGDKRDAIESLETAKKYKRTFYGILALYQLKEKIDYTWDFSPHLNNFYSEDHESVILNSMPLKRVILLSMLGKNDLAEKELTMAYKNLTDKEKEMAMFVCGQYGIHSLAIRIAGNLQEKDNSYSYDYISYPIPTWSQKLSSDKALVLALIRQESRFQETAKSSAGASGLMQLMPNTAFHITKNRNLRGKGEALFEPKLNILIGQKYVEYLMKKPFVNGNLFYLLTAYNAGPGNLIKWKKKVRDNNDPLLFIEAIPARQTRIYIERVMANYWIYNLRMGTESLSIEQVAAGIWPTLD
ncbi:MAG: transglycosylase SLT domain-containing protein [Alphaproteobacteria bacterium]